MGRAREGVPVLPSRPERRGSPVSARRHRTGEDQFGSLRSLRVTIAAGCDSHGYQAADYQPRDGSSRQLSRHDSRSSSRTFNRTDSRTQNRTRNRSASRSGRGTANWSSSRSANWTSCQTSNRHVRKHAKETFSRDDDGHPGGGGGCLGPKSGIRLQGLELGPGGPIRPCTLKRVQRTAGNVG